jgi:hypothetical protein
MASVSNVSVFHIKPWQRDKAMTVSNVWSFALACTTFQSRQPHWLHVQEIGAGEQHHRQSQRSWPIRCRLGIGRVETSVILSLPRPPSLGRVLMNLSPDSTLMERNISDI